MGVNKGVHCHMREEQSGEQNDAQLCASGLGVQWGVKGSTAMTEQDYGRGE